MNPQYQLISFHILEKFNNNKLITWSYPSITNSIKEILNSNALERREIVPYSYYRCNTNDWVYVWERRNETKTYALSLVTNNFNPDKYRQFGKALCNNYEKDYNVVKLVNVFLGAYRTGIFTENGTKINLGSHFTDFKLKDLIRLIGIEVILIYNALLIKKRVFVYDSDFISLQKYLLSITQLIDSKTRDPNDYLFPIINNANQDLKRRTFFVAGITDKNLGKYDYDIFVNLKTQSINISPQSKDTFVLTNLHKDIAKMMVQYTQEDYDDNKLGEELNKKTDDILTKLRTLAATQTAENKSVITLEELRSRKLTPVMENFLFNLAVAENIMML